jgi:hypothetical protein
MRKSNISHKYAKEKDFLIISLLFKHKTVIQNTKRSKNEPAYEKFTRLQTGKLNHQLFLAECHSFTHGNAFAFQKSPFVFITQSLNNTKFCTSESFEAF